MSGIARSPGKKALVSMTALRKLTTATGMLVACFFLLIPANLKNVSATAIDASAARVERLDAGLDRLVPRSASLERVAGGFTWTEGPVWLPTGKLMFSDVASNSIRTWTPGSAASSIFQQPSGYLGATPYGGPEPGSNGLTLDPQGRLTVAGHAQRNVYRLESLDPHARKTILADRFAGRQLNSPNDLAYRSDGSLYFTDPPYGLRQQNDKDPAKELKVNGVYRIPGAASQKPGSQPDRGQLQLIVKDLPRPNGLAFSPDEKYLYVDNSEPQMFWMRYTVQPDGSLRDGKRFGDAGLYAKHGAPDGMKVDREGNLYSAGPGGVWIFSASGVHLGTIDVPETVGNLAWGGTDLKTLYIAASTSIYCIALDIPGVAPAGR